MTQIPEVEGDLPPTLVTESFGESLSRIIDIHIICNLSHGWNEKQLLYWKQF